MVQGCEKIVQSWNVQFKFVPPRTRVMAARLAVALYSPVHSDRVHRPVTDKAVKDLRNVTHAHVCVCVCVYIYIYIYIYIY
jgi:hypothetical protein